MTPMNCPSILICYIIALGIKSIKSQIFIGLTDSIRMATRKQHNPSLKPANQHPIFLVDDDSQDSKPYCYACTQYEQDISLLQEKLMETHNKLIEQIDICRQQQLKIIKLSANHRDGENDTNAGNRQNSGKIFKKFEKNDEEYKHSIQPLIQAKTELLRNDLEAMRAKVLSEITKSNKLKQENRELQMRHDQQLLEYRERIKKLESSRNKLVDQNEKLAEQVNVLKKAQHRAITKCICGFEQKYYQLDKAFMNQRTITNQLIQQNNKLQNKIHTIYESKAKASYKQPQQHQHQHEQIHTQPKRKKPGQGRQNQKQEFEATKNLIKKLEEAELEIRNKTTSNTKNQKFNY